MKRRFQQSYSVLLVVLFGAGCALVDHRDGEAVYAPAASKVSILRNIRLSPHLEDRILALNPDRITENDIKQSLSHMPAPRIINLHGGIPIVYLAMESFARFLVEMGYPDDKIRNPRDGTYSYSPYKSSAELAGITAWYFEKEGIPVILIGHSLGGIQLVSVLHQLAGAFHDKIPVWNPLTERSESRHSIVDPLTGTERPVVGLKIGYAQATGAGWIGRLYPGYWHLLFKLRLIPSTVEHFTGVYIDGDMIGGDFLGLAWSPNKYESEGTAKLRNVKLPSEYSHISVPAVEHLAKNQATRDWINAYVPSDEPHLDNEFETTSLHILWAADVWHSIKKQWCLEAQRLIRAKRQVRS